MCTVFLIGEKLNILKSYIYFIHLISYSLELLNGTNTFFLKFYFTRFIFDDFFVIFQNKL